MRLRRWQVRIVLRHDATGKRIDHTVAIYGPYLLRSSARREGLAVTYASFPPMLFVVEPTGGNDGNG